MDAKQDVWRAIPALMGDGNGTIEVPGQPGYVYIRVGDGDLGQAFNNRCPLADDLAIYVGYDPITDPDRRIFQVLSVRMADYAAGGNSNVYPNVPAHHTSHEFGGGDDVYVNWRRLMGFRVGRPSGFSVTVDSGVIIRAGAWTTLANQTIDLTAHVPAGLLVCYVLIYLNAAGVASHTAGAAAVGATIASCPIPGAGEIPLAAVRLYGTQTAIGDTPTAPDIVDLRFPQAATTGTVHLEDLDGYARGRIIRGGVADWEAYSLAGAAGSFLRRDANDVLWSTLTMPNAATLGDILYASGANAIGNLADVAVGQALVSGGVGAAPAYSATPTLTGLTLSGLTASTVIYSNAGKAITSLANAAGVLTNNGAGVLSWGAAGAGPGGANTNVQYNDGGAFGGDANFTWAKATSVLTLTGQGGDYAYIYGVCDDVNTFGLIMNGGNAAPASGTSGGELSFLGGTGDGAGNGGPLSFTGGNGGATGNGGGVSAQAGSGVAGGACTFAAGASTSGGGNGGDVSFTSGNGDGAGSGGNILFTAGQSAGTGGAGVITIQAGAGGVTSGAGGYVEIIAGSGTAGNSDGGNVTLAPGLKSGAGTDGLVRLRDPVSTLYAILNTASLAAADKTFTFPNASGTFTLGTGTQFQLSLWSATNTVKGLGALGTANAVLQSAGAGADPAWSGFLLTGTAGGTTNFAVTNTKTLTLTATDNWNLTIPATGTAALGTGAATRVAYWSDANTLTSDSGFTYAATGATGLGITRTVADPGATSFNINNIMLVPLTAGNAQQLGAFSNDFRVSGAQTYTGSAFGTNSVIRALTGVTCNTGSLSAFRGIVIVDGTSSMADARGLLVSSPSITAGGAITANHGVYVANQGATGVTNAYGVYIAAQSGAATLNYALYSAGSAAPVYVAAEVRVDGDVGGLASCNTVTGTSDLTANSTGVGTIKFKGATNRDSTGFIKIYIGTTAYYVPVFAAITG